MSSSTTNIRASFVCMINRLKSAERGPIVVSIEENSRLNAIKGNRSAFAALAIRFFVNTIRTMFAAMVPADDFSSLVVSYLKFFTGSRGSVVSG